jgi:hypothetical protein
MRLTADRSTTELRWNVFRISTEGRAYTLRTEALAASGNRLIPILSGETSDALDRQRYLAAYA